MVLRAFQDLLADIYDVPVAHDIYEFLITDPNVIHGGDPGHSTDEQLLVARDGDDLRMSLYLDARVLEHLAMANPLAALDAGNLADCWTALEGVSHFHYLAFHAGHDREVSRLELETQAEIDKYVVTLQLLQGQSPLRFPVELHEILFARTRIDPRLTETNASLYRRASCYAGRFCRRMERMLKRRAVSANRDAAAELRRFYRLTEASKLAHIERWA